jgi:hypothetical protein
MGLQDAVRIICITNMLFSFSDKENEAKKTERLFAVSR